MSFLSLNHAIKYCLLVFLVSLLNNCSEAQETKLEPVNIPLSAEVNKKAEITYTHQKLKNGTGTTGEITAIFEIKSKTDEGFVASWTTKSVKVGDVLFNEKSPKAGSMLLGIPLDFLTDVDGAPTKFLDKEKLLTDLPNSVAFANADEKTIDQVINLFKSMDDDTLANVFFKVPSFMSVCQDTGFVVGEINDFPTKQSNPFGEGELIANISYELTSLDAKKNVANIKYRTEFDEDSVKQMAIKTIKKLAPDTPVSQKEIDQLVVNRTDSADCKVDLSSGWVTDMRYSVMVSASGQVNEEIYDIAVNWLR